MRAKRKLLISMLAIVFVLLAVVATVAIAFALTQQTITTTLNIGYVVEDIDGTASATYTIGGVTESLTAKKGDNVIGDTLVFHAGDTEDAGNLMFPEGQIPLSAQNDNIVIQYTYSNTGAKHYIASMSFDSELVADNMKVEYSINGTDYSTNRYAVVVPANTSNKSYWIKISIENKAKSASFTGDFKWLLSGCDEQEDSYLSLTSVEMQATGTAGSYQVNLAGTGSYVGELVFPSSVNGDPVTTIIGKAPLAEGALTQEQKNQVTSVYIPDSVTTIGEFAFVGYKNLQTVTFEQNEAAGASVQSSTGLKSIGDVAFCDCTSLTSIELPSSVTSIGWEAFASSGLTSIELPSSLTSIGSEVFYYCKGLTSVVIGNGVTAIEGNAFLGCTGLTSITVANGNTKYHSAGNCLIETASKTLLLGCKTSVIPTDGSVTSIGAPAFYGCTGLTSINIPSSVTSIGSSAFYGCTGLKNVTLHTLNSTVVTEIKSLANTNGEMNLTIETVTEIPSGQFNSWDGLTNVVIGNNIETIGVSSFSSCKSLISVEISSSVTTIGGSAFSGCSNLVRVEMGNGVTTIGGSAFMACSKLASINLPNSLTRIEFNAFGECEALTSIEIPANVTFIGESVFLNCHSLDLRIKSGNTAYKVSGGCLIEIGSKTLLFGTRTSVIPTDGSVTKIGQGSLVFFSGSINIVIPESVTEIRSAAIYFTDTSSVIFENKTGWSVNGTAITEEQLNDPENAANIAMQGNMIRS